MHVALRKESVDRNAQQALKMMKNTEVALRKESVDRNTRTAFLGIFTAFVALRKESVDRNEPSTTRRLTNIMSLSARRAWIEIKRPHNSRI